MSSSFIPPYAVTIWTDAQNIYVHVPAKQASHPPLILKYALTEGGMAKALAFTQKSYRDSQPKGGYSTYTMPPQAPGHVAKSKTAAKYTAEDRAKASELLRKLGLGK